MKRLFLVVLLVGLMSSVALGVKRRPSYQPDNLWSSQYTVSLDRTNSVEIEGNNYTCLFTTQTGQIIPAFIEGYRQVHGRVKDHKRQEGIQQFGSRPRIISTAIYCSVRLDTPRDLSRFVLIGPDGYRVEVDLDVFWGGDHKSQRQYGMTFYL